MMYRYLPRSVPPAREAFWVRHPHLGGCILFAALVCVGLLLAGCECGVGWPCPREGW